MGDKYKLAYSNVKVTESSCFDGLVEEVYGRPYCFFEQEYGRKRGLYRYTVPDYVSIDFYNDDFDVQHGEPIIPSEVSMEKWLNMDPAGKPIMDMPDFQLRYWWYRKFYPDTQELFNDLHRKGIVDAGEYGIEVI